MADQERTFVWFTAQNRLINLMSPSTLLLAAMCHTQINVNMSWKISLLFISVLIRLQLKNAASRNLWKLQSTALKSEIKSFSYLDERKDNF